MEDDTKQFYEINALSGRINDLEIKTQLAEAERKTMKEHVDKLNATVYGTDENQGLREGTKQMQKVINEDLIPAFKRTERIIYAGGGIIAALELGIKLLEHFGPHVTK